MSDGNCDSASEKKKFCAIRAVPKCADCTQLGSHANHREACKAETKDWNKGYAFRSLHGGEGRWYSYEAHHLLCVSSVGTQLLGHAEIEPLIRETDWCINKPKNMIAMPLWGHTIKWYCTIGKDGSHKLKDVEAPGFANIPQHNLGHNGGGSYRTEIDDDCGAQRDTATEAEHGMTGAGLAKRLDRLSDRWRKKLVEQRGKRRGGGARTGGTHAAWQAASKRMSEGKAPAADWFLPFSMAADAEEDEVPPPTYDFDEKFSTWVDKLAQAMKVK